MLTAKEIGKYIVSPGLIQASDLDELKNLTEKYPYTQLFSILYLKGMSASNSVDFEASLKEHSYRISDRAQLYKLIHDHDQKSPEIAIAPEEIVENSTEKEFEVIEPVEETKVERLVSEVENTEVETQENYVAAEPESSYAKTETEEIENVVKEIDLESEEETLHEEITPAPTELSKKEVQESEEETQEELEVASEQDELPTSIKKLGPNLQFELDPDFNEKIEEAEKPQDALEESIMHHVYANQYQLPELTQEEKEALEKNKKEEVKSSEVVSETRETEYELPIENTQTFTNWLHANSNYSEPLDTEKKAINSLVEDFSAFDPLESLSGEFEKPKKEFFSPSKKAKESLSENKLPVSETLAKIYVMQGNYPKAISAYNELILAFPEKKIFFANQIGDLQKKLNK